MNDKKSVYVQNRVYKKRLLPTFGGLQQPFLQKDILLLTDNKTIAHNSAFERKTEECDVVDFAVTFAGGGAE